MTTRARSRTPVASNRQSSTFSAYAENNAKFAPRRSAVAPSGYGIPAETRIHGSRADARGRIRLKRIRWRRKIRKARDNSEHGARYGILEGDIIARALEPGQRHAGA